MSAGGSFPMVSVHSEFQHLKAHWWWLFLFGVLLTVCGAATIICPTITLVTSFAAMIFLGVTLIVAGVATIVASFWAGRWSGLLLELLVGILYVVAGFLITERPVESAVAMTSFIAAMFIVVGAFRTVAALVVRFPHWGWALLNGIVTLLCGVVIYRHFPQSGLWLIGLLIGLELLFHGLMWIMLSVSIRNLPNASSPAPAP